MAGHTRPHVPVLRLALVRGFWGMAGRAATAGLGPWGGGLGLAESGLEVEARGLGAASGLPSLLGFFSGELTSPSPFGTPAVRLSARDEFPLTVGKKNQQVAWWLRDCTPHQDDTYARRASVSNCNKKCQRTKFLCLHT